MLYIRTSDEWSCEGRAALESLLASSSNMGTIPAEAASVQSAVYAKQMLPSYSSISILKLSNYLLSNLESFRFFFRFFFIFLGDSKEYTFGIPKVD